MLNKKEIKEEMNKLKNMNKYERAEYFYQKESETNEKQLISFLNSGMLKDYVAGDYGSRFPDESNLSFTNAGVVLDCVYRVFNKYPELNINIALEDALIELLKGTPGDFYGALNTIDMQLYNEKKNQAPFKIGKKELFESLKKSIADNIDLLKTCDAYRGRLYENKLYGFVEDINKKIEEEKGISIL